MSKQTKNLGLPAFFELRDEAKKRWHYLATDKFVYVSQILNRELYSSLFVSEEDFEVRPWIEAHFILGGQRNAHYCLVTEFPFLNPNSGRDFKKRAGIKRMNANDAVFTCIPEEIEPPERVGFVRLPQRVWLKRLHEGNCVGVNADCGRIDFSLCARAVSRTYGEAGFAGRSLLANFGQVPCDMIEGRPQIIDEVAPDQSDADDFDSPDGFYFDRENPPFRILICGDSIKLFGLLSQRGEVTIESIQVNLRPIHFEIALLGYHDWPLLCPDPADRVMISA